MTTCVLPVYVSLAVAFAADLKRERVEHRAQVPTVEVALAGDKPANAGLGDAALLGESVDGPSSTVEFPLDNGSEVGHPCSVLRGFLPENAVQIQARNTHKTTAAIHGVWKSGDGSCASWCTRYFCIAALALTISSSMPAMLTKSSVQTQASVRRIA